MFLLFDSIYDQAQSDEQIYKKVEEMLGDMFDTEEELLTGQKQGAILNAYSRLPRNCAHELPLPQVKRKPGTPAGLKNQGATCYLNGLLQVLFFTPQFRSMILSLPLCSHDDITKQSGYLNKESKFNFVMGFQKLFSEMQILDAHSISTEHLNKAFGWEKVEHLQQHDMHEAMRVILDTLERALEGTPASAQAKSNFKGMNAKYISCLGCNKSRDTPEPFFELLTQVKGYSSLGESIQGLITPAEMFEGNRIFCQNCGAKTDSLLGLRLVSLPNILIIALSRFEFDLQKLDQVKLTTPLSFDLELNMGGFGVTDKHTDFELYGIVIHRGSAHGGHYIAYVRDVLYESSWKDNLEEKKTEEKKEKEKKEEQDKKEQKDKKKEESKEKIEKDSYQLKEPKDGKLAEGWYEINDSVVTPIPSSRIATQFGGSQSAYILFYRRRGAEYKIPEVPLYLRKVIEGKNEEFQKARDIYNFEKQHIILKINGSEYRVNRSVKIAQLLDVYCPDGVLVNKEEKNGLDYYPQQLTREDENKTIQQVDIPHLSIWESMEPSAEGYLKIKHLIGKDKVPVSIALTFESKVDQFVTTQDLPFLQLRQHIESHYKIPYEHQIVTLNGNRKQQKNLAENSSNDELTLLQLKMIHGSQLFVDRTTAAQGGEVKEPQPELLTVIVERDDEPGVKRHYVQKAILLSELLERVVKMEGVDKTKKRLRWLNGNRLFFLDQYSKSLEQLGVEESLVRLRLERGDVPEKGEVCVKVKMQSKFQPKDAPQLYELVVDPSISLTELKKTICEHFKLEHLAHKLYRTDWMGEPSRPITKQGQNLFEACFSNQQKICLRDNESPTNLQLSHFNVSITQTGFPDNCEKGFDIKCEQTKTLKELKEMMLEVPLIKALAQGRTYKHLRLRELKRDYMFGNIFRGDNKILKSTNIPDCSNLVIQILDKEEELGEDDIVLVLKSRDSEKKVYRQSQEFVFKASKVPKLIEFKKALLEFKDIELGPEEIRVAKYYHNDFEWIELTEQNFKKWLDARHKKKQADAKAKQKAKANKAKKQQTKESKINETTQKNEEVEKKPKKSQVPKDVTLRIEQNKQVIAQTKVDQNVQNKPKKQGKKPKENKQNQQNSNQPKAQKKQPQKGQQQKKPKNKKHQEAQQPKKDPIQEENLRKVPFFFKDGDIIGYGFACEILEGDDFQTQEDQKLRVIKQIQTGKIKDRKHRKENPFALTVDF